MAARRGFKIQETGDISPSLFGQRRSYIPCVLNFVFMIVTFGTWIGKKIKATVLPTVFKILIMLAKIVQQEEYWYLKMNVYYLDL